MKTIMTMLGTFLGSTYLKVKDIKVFYYNIFMWGFNKSIMLKHQMYTTSYYRNIPVYMDDKAIRFLAIDYTSPTITGFFAIQSPTKGIVVSENFNSLPIYVRDFTLAHEAGHIENEHNFEHLSQLQLANLRNKNITKGIVMREVLEADIAAYHEIGLQACLEALEYLKINMPMPSIAKQELALRIEALKSFDDSFKVTY